MARLVIFGRARPAAQATSQNTPNRVVLLAREERQAGGKSMQISLRTDRTNFTGCKHAGQGELSEGILDG